MASVCSELAFDGKEVAFMSSYHRIDFSSPSLSLGKSAVHVDVLEKNPQMEPRVLWNVSGKHFYSTDCLKCFDELKYSACRTSVFENKDASLRIASPEHLAPVFLMWPSRCFNVNVELFTDEKTAEIPMMDGSAILFFNKIRREAGVPEELAFYDAPVHMEWGLYNVDGAGVKSSEPYGCVRISPSESFEVDYILDRPDLQFKSAASVSIYSAEDLYNIFESRTFIFEKEYEKARAAGLLSGVDETCGLLLSDEVPERKTRFRVDEEPARHKILDLLGDLAFAKPALPRVRIEIINGGHLCHRQIFQEIFKYAL